MPMKASILLLCILAGFSESARGQNIEQDLELARTHLASEKRIEALKVLGPWMRDDRARSLHQIAQTTFFVQGTADLYYEGMRWLGLGKFQDAQDRFAQANAREPGNTLVLTRMIQSELILGKKDQAKLHWLEVKAHGTMNRELRVYGLKLLVEDAFAPAEDHRSAIATKSECLPEEVPAAFYAEYLVKTGRISELRGLLRQWLDQKQDWALPLIRGIRSPGIPEELRKKIRARLEKLLKDRAQFESRVERDGQRHWSGFIRYDDLVKELAGLAAAGSR